MDDLTPWRGLLRATARVGGAVYVDHAWKSVEASNKADDHRSESWRAIRLYKRNRQGRFVVRVFFGGLGIALAILGLMPAAHSETAFPIKPVTIIVSYPAGGASDVATRILADGLSKFWNQQVIVENRPGGGMVIGMSAVQRAKPDGYTLGFIAAPFAINPSLRKDLPYDTVKDFAGLTVFQTSPYGIAASPALEANTIEALIELGKKRRVTFATSGLGSGNHMVAELVQNVAGVKWQHIPYKGDADAVADILTGRVDFTVSTWSNLRPFVESGKMKLLAISNAKRLPEVPNVPTLREAFPNIGLDPVAWNGINAPAGLPADIVAKIDEAMKAVTTSSNFKDQIVASGANPEYRSPVETDATIKREIETWTRVVNEQNIVLQ